METNPDRLSDLMQRYAAGEESVFDELYRSIAPRLYRFSLRLTSNRAEADDLFQDALLRLHRARATYLAGSNALHWAFAIVRSVHLDRLRYRRRRPEDLGAANDAAENAALPIDGGHTPEAEALARDLMAIVTMELSRMSEKNRAAYVLLKEEGLSVKAAAEVLGTTATVVRQRAHRAYEQLRAAVGVAGWGERNDDGSWNTVPVRV
jgi:RNA polymerase sigma-70 factor (ECF subfamily)